MRPVCQIMSTAQTSLDPSSVERARRRHAGSRVVGALRRRARVELAGSRSCLTAQTIQSTQSDDDHGRRRSPTVRRWRRGPRRWSSRLVSTIRPPAATPRTRAARWRDQPGRDRRGDDAADEQRRRRSRQSMPWLPSANRKPSEPPTATTNSEVSIEPTTLRGSSRPEESSEVVPTGPQPPPPIASISAGRRPRAARGRRPTGWPWNVGRRPPRAQEPPDDVGAEAQQQHGDPGLPCPRRGSTRNVAPAKAPRSRARAMMPTVRQSMLPSLWWENPETSEVPISEKWTAAEAAAGASRWRAAAWTT